MRVVGILGTGSYLPETRVGLDEFVRLGADPDLLERWDVSEHRVAVGETSTDMETKAALQAIASAGLEARDIDLILGIAPVPEQLNPSNATLTQYKIGACAPAVGIDMSCAGSVPALQFAAALVGAGAYRHVLVVASYDARCAIDRSDPAVYAVMGDGAGAMVVGEVSDGNGFLGFEMDTEGRYWSKVGIAYRPPKRPNKHEPDESRLRLYLEPDTAGSMDEFRQWSLKSMNACVMRLLKRLALAPHAIDWICPHQNVKPVAGQWIADLGVPTGRVLDTRRRYGNLGAANILVNIHEGAKHGRFSPGECILSFGQGSGMSNGAFVVRWSRQSNSGA